MALTQRYVDPAAGSDTTGDGSIGNPWKTVQKALDAAAQSAGGDQINVKAGTAATPGATLSLATYGTPADTKPLVIRGYTAAANDGGIGDISGGGGNFPILNVAAPASGVALIDLKLRDTGTAAALILPNSSLLKNCEISGADGGGAVTSGGTTSMLMLDCYVHDVGGYGFDGAGLLFMNTFANGTTRKFTSAIRLGLSGIPSLAEANIVRVDGTSNGIEVYRANCRATRNTVFGGGGTGKGFKVGAGGVGASTWDNHVEGFSVGGGVGYYADAGTVLGFQGGNTSFNNATATSNWSGFVLDLGGPTALGASPLTNPAGGDFSASSALDGIAAFASFPGLTTDQHFTVGAAQRDGSAGGGAEPDAGDLREGVVVGSTTGTLVLPTADKVLLGEGFGADGTEVTGTRRDAPADQVVAGTVYGPDDAITGTYEVTALTLGGLQAELNARNLTTENIATLAQKSDTMKANLLQINSAAPAMSSVPGVFRVDVGYVNGQAAAVADGTAQGGGASTITLDADAAPSIDGGLDGRTIYLEGGTGAGQWNVVTAYDGTTKVATVRDAWAVQPAAGTTYVLGDPAGTGATAADIFAFDVEGGRTFVKTLRGMWSILLGKVSGMDANAPVFRDAADTKDRITAATDADGNRTAVTINDLD